MVDAVKKTIIRYEGSGPLPEWAIDGSDEFLPESERLSEKEKARPPLISWPEPTMPDNWGSPRRRGRKRPDAA